MAARTFTPFPVLQTERLTLRRLTGGDAHEIFALRSDPAVNRYLGRKPNESLADAKAFIAAIDDLVQRDESVYWAISQKGGDALVGTICLFDFSVDNRKAEIGYELLPAFQGKGLMQEALEAVLRFAKENLGLQRIDAFSHRDNRGSTRQLEQFHFQRQEEDGDLVLFFRDLSR